ncbi:MAG: hypothetical protein OXC29_25035, partial [Rhodococcus sp.]|nr:hypothetical protein [Rhodococcus sp. (in: high G+C Gram-positive bacteria)]
MSMWTTHMSGTTDAEPPPPPLSVTFTLPPDADSSAYMVADEDDDEETAMAWLNPEIVVDANANVVITPDFLPGANGVGSPEGIDTPFSFVGAEDNWELKQSDVLADGATFMVQRALLGANQMEPTDGVMFITCGPFACIEGKDKPVLSLANSADCNAWDPSVTITAGKVDNDVMNREELGELKANDGIDIGIATSSSLAMKVKHNFFGVSGGKNITSTVDAAEGSDQILAMKAVADVILVSADVDDTGTANTDESVICDNPYEDEDVSLKVDRPGGDNCFRLIGPATAQSDNDASKGANYLTGWSIELSPVDADVSWGKVDWDDDPFEELTCKAKDPIMVDDRVDVCEMLDDEITGATGKGWKPEVVFDENNRVVMWRAGATAATGHERMFKALWFDDNLNGKILEDTTGRAARRPDPDGPDGAGTAAGAQARLHDLYDQDEDDNNINKIWQFLTDDDGDLLDSVGDLGKVDLLSDEDDPKTADNETTIALEACASGVTWRATTTAQITTGCGGTDGTDGDPAAEVTGSVKTNPDGNADNYVNATESVAFSDFRGCSEDDGGDDADGSECDATWEDTFTITFAALTFGCERSRDITVTCKWDADGGMAQGRNALPDAADLDSAATNTDNNRANFITCSAK